MDRVFKKIRKVFNLYKDFKKFRNLSLNNQVRKSCTPGKIYVAGYYTKDELIGIIEKGKW